MVACVVAAAVVVLTAGVGSQGMSVTAGSGVVGGVVDVHSTPAAHCVSVVFLVLYVSVLAAAGD